MSILNNYELDVAREVISMSLANAADSFSKITGEKVLIQDYELHFIQKEETSQVLSGRQEKDWYILTTHIVGKLEAQSYLLFNRTDVEKLLQMLLPDQPFIEGSRLNELQTALLLELDNIVTAAMVTQISNFLNLFVYGDVPRFCKLSGAHTLDYFSQATADFDHILHAQARFHCFRTQMNPLFICFFKKEFLVEIQGLVAKRKHLNLINQNKVS